MADAVLKLAGLNEPIRGFGGRPLPPLKDAQGEPLPADEQLTLGNVLLNLVATMDPEGKAKDIIVQRRVGDAIYAAMADGGTYDAGSIAVGLLRKAATQNKPGYRVLILGQVWEAIGTGDD